MADPMALVVADAAAQARRVRRPARGAAQPGPGGGAPGDGAEVEPRSRGDLERPGRREGASRWSGPAPPARRSLPVGQEDRSRRRATSTLTTTLAGGSTRSTDPTWVAGRAYYEPSEHGSKRRSAARMTAVEALGPVGSPPWTGGLCCPVQWSASEVAALIAAVVVAMLGVALIFVLRLADPDARHAAGDDRGAAAGHRPPGRRPARDRAPRPTPSSSGSTTCSAPPSRSRAPSTRPRGSPIWPSRTR